MNYPEYAEIDGKKYKINTDFRVAIECNRIAEDDTIGDFERALAIIYTLFGEAGLNDVEHYDKLFELALKYLLHGKELNSNHEIPDMDYIEDAEYIQSSFKYDYNYNPYEMEYLHWYSFFSDLNNLSNSEFGNCCILNRVRNFRNLDEKEIKDRKERERVIKIKKSIALTKYKKTKHLTKEQEKSASDLNKKLGL